MHTLTQLVKETKTEYNNSTRQWLVFPAELSETEALTAGKIIIFPAGIEGKRAAQLSALTSNAPAVAAVCESLIHQVAAPGWIDRVIRAGYIVAKGDVLLAPGRNYITVRSQNQHKSSTEYLVQRRVGLGWFCQCHDWQDGREARFYPRETFAPTIPGLGTMCKHCLAVLIAVKLGLVSEEAL